MQKKRGTLKIIKRVVRTPDRDSTAKGGKKLGAIKEAALAHGTTVGHRSCYAKCEGRWIGGMWIHSDHCPYIVVLWKAHGYTRSHWECPYGCEAQEMPSGYTHDWCCPFWQATDATPIGLKPPRTTTPGQDRAH